MTVVFSCHDLGVLPDSEVDVICCTKRAISTTYSKYLHGKIVSHQSKLISIMTPLPQSIDQR